MALRKMPHRKIGNRDRQRSRSGELTRLDVKPLDVRAHHLLCAICVRGGCRNPPAGRWRIDLLLKRLWRYPYFPLRVTADLDLNRAHYSDIYAGRGRLPRNYWKRQADFVGRRKDLETLRQLGIVPNTVIPAYLAYTILLSRVRSLEGICKSTPPG